MIFKLFNTQINFDYLILIFVCVSLLFNSYSFIYVVAFALLHEFGHLAILILFKQKIEILNINIYGIGIKFNNCLSKWQEIVYLIAGPLVNLIFVLVGVKKEINLALFVINILPIYPLDGGRILKTILYSLFSNLNIDKVFQIISIASLLAIFVISLLMKNISLFIVSVYLFIYSFKYSYC